MYLNKYSQLTITVNGVEIVLEGVISHDDYRQTTDGRDHLR